MRPIDVGKANRSEQEHRHPEPRHPSEPTSETARCDDTGQNQEQCIGHEWSADRSQPLKRSDDQRVEERLAVGDVSTLVPTQQDEAFGLLAPMVQEALVILCLESQIEVPSQAFTRHEIGGLIADEGGPLETVERQRSEEDQTRTGGSEGVPGRPLAFRRQRGPPPHCLEWG